MTARGDAPGAGNGSQARPPAAVSFGTDPERYDRARPRYPEALIERIAGSAPGGLVLDIGTATGIVARQLQSAGCRVLGVDPDLRLAEFARQSGVEVEAATFEDWDPAGRVFDAIVAGESWHWVDAEVGASKAAAVLRPGGRAFLFWNTGQPMEGLDEAFLEVYRRVLPAPFADRLTRPAMEAAHAALSATGAQSLQTTGSFDQPQESQLAWARSYPRDEWLDALRTSGGAIPEDRFAQLINGIGNAIDAAGGRFTMQYTTFVVTAQRRS